MQLSRQDLECSRLLTQHRPTPKIRNRRGCLFCSFAELCLRGLRCFNLVHSNCSDASSNMQYWADVTDLKIGTRLSLQRHIESFPFFEFTEAAFTMGLIGLVIALLMIAHESQNVLRFPFRIGQSPFDQLPGLRQCQGWSFFKLQPQPHQEQLRQKHQPRMPVPGRPGPMFVVVQSPAPTCSPQNIARWASALG